MKKLIKITEAQLRTLKEYGSGIDDKPYMSLDTLRKSVITMLDWGWTVEEIHKIIDQINEIHGKKES